MTALADPRQNRLLAALPPPLWARWQAHLACVDLALGQVLAQPDVPYRHVYFPTRAIVSMLYETAEGGCVETAVIGNDGVVGLAVVMGGDSTPQRPVVQVAGPAIRLPAAFVKHEFEHHPALVHLLLRYADARVAQVGQIAACNRHHTLEQRLCRHLLLCMDRSVGDTLVMTQERIAHALGVRREGVTGAVGRLQRAGLIRHARGRVTVLDRPGLEQRSCECYAVVRTGCRRMSADALAC